MFYIANNINAYRSAIRKANILIKGIVYMLLIAGLVPTVVHGQEVHQDLFSSEERMFLPDGPHCQANYITTSSIIVSGYADNATIQSAANILSVCFTAEHSYLGDLTINLKCPSYTSTDSTGHGLAVLHYKNVPSGVTVPPGTSNGGGRFLGIPYGGNNHNNYDGTGGTICDSLANPYGFGVEYCFSRNAGYTLVNGDPANTAMPANAGLANAPTEAVTHVFPPVPAGYTQAGDTCDTAHVNMLPASNRVNKSGYYVPATDFSSLVGCPVNGEWKIELFDTYGVDNGWLFGWNIEFEGIEEESAGSDHCVESNCGAYQWPPVPSSCPEVTIKQKYDHEVNERYQQQGWDTAVTCTARSIELSSTPYIPVKYFNGYYCVETIPYAPTDTTFSSGTAMNLNLDDKFSPATNIGFPFYFFGVQKTQFCIGTNGVMSFNPDAAGQMCPYTYTAPLPWPDGTSGAPMPLGVIRDAIYGIFEDTDPRPSFISGDQGIFYNVIGEYPCRKIIASWNGVPAYPAANNLNNRCTYQIVCYEGSNIIEVHVKKRSLSSTNWQGNKGIIGIQNATGEGQLRGATGTSTMHVQNGAPAAFWPDGRNIFTTSLDETSYRFTPLGINPSVTSGWYRIFDDGRADVALTQDVTDTNGYYIPMDAADSTCPTLTRAFVQPTMTSRYVYRLRFQNANGDWYDLADTITIGVDTLYTLTIKDEGTNDVSEEAICFGEVKNYMLTMNALQDTQQMTWVVTRSNNGSSTTVPLSMLHLDTMRVSGGNRQMPFSINTSEIYGGTSPTSADTITVTCMVNFTNGCANYCQLKLTVLPSTVDDTVADVCDSLIWHGTTYRNSTVATHTAGGGCGVIRLTLTVRHSTDTTIVRDVVENNLPYIIDTLTLTHDTTFIMHSVNKVGCDSTITVTVIVHRNQDTTISSTACEGELPLTWNGIDFYLSEVDTTTGIITHTALLTTQGGADSVVTMHLLVLANSQATLSDTVRQNDLPSFVPPLPIASISFTDADTMPALVRHIDTTITIPNAAGCDSLVHYTLYVYRNYHTYDTVSRCINQLPYIYHGDTITGPAGEMHDSVTLTTVNGTDSILILTLRINPTYEAYDTVVICPNMPFVYEGTDYGGPADIDTTLLSQCDCDSLVHMSLQQHDTLLHIAPQATLDSLMWPSGDTTLLGCTPQKVWLRDTTKAASHSWMVWRVSNGSADTIFSTDSTFSFSLNTGIYSFRLVSTYTDGCADTLRYDSSIYVFRKPVSNFIYEPNIVPFHDPQIDLTPTATPADSLTYSWLISTAAQGSQYDTLYDGNQQNGRWHYAWEPLIDSGHYDIALVAHWLHKLNDSLNVTCTDTAHIPVMIVNTHLDFPTLVTPNGDGSNDRWEIVNLVEMGQYPMNELWIYNQWGALVFHAKDISSSDQFWDPNATNSPDGAYFFRFSGRGRYGVIKFNGVIEVLR